MSDEIKTELGEQESKQDEITPQQLFDNSHVLLGNSLKLMSEKYGGGFYIKFLQDIGSKRGWLQLIIAYPDNRFKTLLLCKNMFMEAQLDGQNIGTVERGEGEEKTLLYPLLSTSLEYGHYRELEQYETPNMPIPAKALWKLVIDNYEKIPVTTIYQTEDLEGMYWELYRIAHEAANSDNFQEAYRMNDRRFLVRKKEMEKVATDNGITLSQLRTELNLLGLLVKDKGSTAESGKRYNSYQLTKKVNGLHERFYAIKLRIKTSEPVIDTSVAVEFSEELTQTQAEAELKKAKEQIGKLKNSIEEKEKEIHELYQNRVDDLTSAEILKYMT